MEVIFRKSAGGEVTPDQHARASAAVDRVLQGSRHSVWDALTAMDYLTAWDDCPPEQRAELGKAAADLDERLELFNRLQGAASEAAGELVWLSLRPASAL